jgi:hypothetical protein
MLEIKVSDFIVGRMNGYAAFESVQVARRMDAESG